MNASCEQLKVLCDVVLTNQSHQWPVLLFKLKAV